jgi:2'-5' RNA ligase
MGSPSVPGEPINQYALVTYLPEELGAFLDQVRKELVPACQARSHLSILPPRSLAVPAEQAEMQVQLLSRHVQPFVVRVGAVEVFPITGVIYLELEAGKEAVETLHASLNLGAFSFPEPYPFHPHITLAQNFPVDAGLGCLDQARDKWAGYQGRREFLLDRVVFVQNSNTNCWKDLRTFPLQGMPQMTPHVAAESVIRTF